MLVHRLLAHTRAEGPGARSALWVQGCSIRCTGCFNPGTWASGGGRHMSVAEAVAALTARDDLEGVTFLGGEPFDQAASLAAIARAVRDRGLSVMTFTGHDYDALRAAGRRDWDALLAATDLLVDGPFRADLADTTRPWVGSTNQRFRHLTDRYAGLDGTFGAGQDQLEVRIRRDGAVEVNGLATVDQLDALLDGLGRRRPSHLLDA